MPFKLTLGGVPAGRAPRSLVALAALAAATWANPAIASPLEYTFDTSGSGSSSLGGNLEFFANENSSVTIKVRSYSIPDGGGAFSYATTNIFGGGIGARNQFSDGGSPNHAIDNAGHNDLVLFEFDSDDYTVESFMIGWSYLDSDVRVWVGGSGAGLDLTASPCGGSCTLANLAGLGFTQLPDFWNVANNTPVDLGTSVSGRYMIVAGGDEDYKEDYFKLNQIIAQTTMDTPEVPEPSTIIIFGVGLAALGYAWRRQASR